MTTPITAFVEAGCTSRWDPKPVSETFVSVIMPIYNAAPYVVQAARSVLEQTHSHLELIAVDDGSQDDGASRLEAIDDPRLTVIRKPNGGVSSARNAALRQARGEVIALIDADDAWEPDKLARHLTHLTERPDVGISYCPSAMMDADGQMLGLTQSPKLRGLTPLDVYCGRAVQNGSVPVFRRAVFEAVAFEDPASGERCYFDESLARYEDFECWMRMALKTPWQFEGIEPALTRYRLNPSGLSANVAGQCEGWLAAFEKIKAYAPDFIAAHGRAARAYAMRNFARRSVKARDGRAAWAYTADALKSWPAIVWEEPGKSLTTVFAAGLLGALPKSAFTALETLAMGRKTRGPKDKGAER